jgi:glycosyltransferase involved in cell wall biosynthesis
VSAAARFTRTTPAPQAVVRAVFIAFEFPPLATGGVYRALGLVEQLPAYGVDLDVVTVDPAEYPAWTRAPFDAGLAARVPASTRVHHTASGFPGWYWRLTRRRLGAKAAQLAFWGDPVSLFWRRPLFEALDRIVEERRPDVLLATAPPFGVAVLARAAARRYGLPWVADWRDPWTLWRMTPFPSYAHYQYVKAQEGAALREANVSVATSHVTCDEWKHTFPSADPRRMVTVYNGYDRAALRAAPVPPPRTTKERTIVHVGNFYYDPQSRAGVLLPFWKKPAHRWLFYTPRREDWLYRSPYFFLLGLRRFADRNPALAARLRVRFAGSVPKWLPAMLRDTGTESLVELLGWVDHSTAARLAKGADALLLTSAKVIGGRDYSVAGKLFEYVGLRRPVLGVLTDGAMRDLIAASGLGILSDPDDTDAVASAIAHIVKADRPGSLVQPNEAFIASCDRNETARAMAGLLRRAAAEGYRGHSTAPRDIARHGRFA